MLILTMVAMIALIAAYVRSRLNELEVRIREVSGSAPTWQEFETLLRRVDALESATTVRDIRPEPEKPKPATAPAAPLPKEEVREEAVFEPVVVYEPPVPSYSVPVAVQAFGSESCPTLSEPDGQRGMGSAGRRQRA